MSPSRSRSRSVRLAAVIAIPLLAVLTLFSWSFSSAVGSSPDDDFHLASIWCGLGDRPGLCEEPGGTTGSVERMVPAPVAQAICAAQHADVSGSCWNGNAPGLALVKRANVDHLYPPVFYGAMSVFASKDVAASVIAMRLANSVIAVGLITAVFLFLPRRLRPALTISVLAASVPLGLFVFASTNPSSWALLSAATVWVSLYGALIAPTRRQSIVLTSLAVLAAVLGAGARADAALFAVFGAMIALWLGLRRGRGLLVPLVGGAAILVISVALYFSATQSSAATGGLGGYGARLSGGELVRNVLDIPSLWIGIFGYWPLGWFDTGVPSVVWVLGSAVFGFVLLAGLHGATRRRVVASLAALAAMWFVPFYILWQSGAHVGEGVQPRYIMPLMIIALGVSAASERTATLWRGWPLIVAAAALALTNAVSLHINIQRYTTGLDKTSLDPGSHAEWWWGWAPSPMGVWLIGSVAFALLLAGLLWANRQYGDEAETEVADAGASSAPAADADYESSKTEDQVSALESDRASAR
ncbi:DUF2142 domain-containing protein [Microbacterium sp. NPDC089698]|uniref:DUF2142 domain-containing protein n=1 Tax=Microbacterium sp. NPDC089698 TaxID=3364200 RepID=UPI00382F2911